MAGIPLFKVWCNAVEAYGFDQLMMGFNIPGYKLVEGKRGDKKWAGDDQAILKSLEEFGIKKEEVITEKIKTPTMVEKILKAKKQKPKVIEDLWTQSKGGPTIAKASDKRNKIESEQEAAFKAVEN